MERQGINKAYMQPTNMADAGTKEVAGKDSMNPCDAACHSPFTKSSTAAATPKPDSDIDTLRELQLGSNGYQSNGYRGRNENDPAPTRGFGTTPAKTGGYQGN